MSFVNPFCIKYQKSQRGHSIILYRFIRGPYIVVCVFAEFEPARVVLDSGGLKLLDFYILFYHYGRME